MKTLPGIKIALFFTLVFAVTLAVYAGPKGTKLWNKKHKLLIQFGWTETNPPELNPAPHSLSDIKSYLTGTGKPTKYKLQHYTDGNPDGAPEGDLGACLPTFTPPSATMNAANATATASPTPHPGPSGTPSGAKTQSLGLVQFDDPSTANDFIDWVNSTAAVPANGSSNSKKHK